MLLALVSLRITHSTTFIHKIYCKKVHVSTNQRQCRILYGQTVDVYVSPVEDFPVECYLMESTLVGPMHPPFAVSENDNERPVD